MGEKRTPVPDWMPGREEDKAAAKAGRLGRGYLNAVLLAAFAAAAFGALAWADYLFAVLGPFLAATAMIGLALAGAGLAAFIAVCMALAGRLPPAGDWLGTFLFSLVALPALVISLTVLTNSWLDRSSPEVLQALVVSRDDRRRSELGTSGRRYFRFHDSYINLRADRPGGEEFRLPGDYSSTRELRPGERVNVGLRRGFWGLEHVALMR